MARVNDSTIDQIRNFVVDGVQAERFQPTSDPFWQALRSTGTELWLDTGDIDAATANWSAEMSALTTNNTLLNREIQKGIYDDYIRRAGSMLAGLDEGQRIQEIAFILNARHGLTLARTFGCKVSVELHTDLAHDLEGIEHYGRRFHEIEPEHFIVKVPLTASGLLGARRLRELGIEVNFTLEFSARQNALVSVISRANYCNVFLGRLNSYVADQDLGSGENVGERATISSQRIIRELTGDREEPTRQIAASLREASQVTDLAGVDVFTIPTKVAAAAKAAADEDGSSHPRFEDQTDTDYPVTLAAGVEQREIQIEKLWEVEAPVVEFAQSCDASPPGSGDELAARAVEAGLGDMFPQLSSAELEQIAADGKIPKHQRWKTRIASGEVAVDTLLNLAGLASFAADQQELDERIAGLIS